MRGAQVPKTIAWYLLAFVAYGGALLWAERRNVPMRWVWAAAVCFRLVLLLTVPTLSDDVYRYLWDGHVAESGISPYAYPIDSPQLDHLDTTVRAKANNRWMATPYLPAGQGLFLVVATLFPLKPIFMQVAMVLSDLASAWLISKLLALAKMPARRLLLYLWNPLVIVEVAHGAHIDAWMVVLSLAAVYLTLGYSRKTFLNAWPLAPLVLALATLTKILPALLLPVLFWYWNWRQRLLYAVASFGLLIPSAVRAGWGLTGPLTGRGLFGAIRIYSAQWNFNSGLFHWLEVSLGASGYGPPLTQAKVIVGVALTLVLIGIWWRSRSAGRSTREIRKSVRFMSVPLIAYLLLSPTVHPWYALPVLAFLPFLPPADDEPQKLWLAALPWIYLSAAFIFSYLTYLDPHNFGEREWVRRLEWVPTILFAIALFVFKIAEIIAEGRIRARKA